MDKQQRWQLIAASALIGGFAAGFGLSSSRPPLIIANVVLPKAAAPEFEEPLTFSGNATPIVGRELPQPTAEERTMAQEAVLRALQEPTLIRRQHALFLMLEKMELEQISAVAALAQRLSGSERDVLLPLLAGRWAEIDPAASLHFALSLAGELQQRTVRSAIETWVAQDAEAATAAITASPRSKKRNFLLSTLIDTLAKRDPAAALRLASSVPESRSLGVVFSAWAKRDPAAAAGHALQVTSRKDRLQAINSTVAAWAESDPRAALTWAALQIREPEEQESALSLALSSWVRMDPASAAAYIHNLPSGPQRDDAVSSVLPHLARSDVQAGQALIERMSQGSKRSWAIRSFVQIWADHDPRAAADYVSKMPSLLGLADTMGRISQKWAEFDLDGAFTWMATLPPGDERNFVQRSITLQWASANPRAAGEYAAQHLLEEQAFMGGIAGTWARQDAGEALAWGLSLPEGRTKNEVVKNVVSQLAARDLPAAANAVFSMPAELQANTAVQVARRWAQTDLRGASAWASRLADDEAQVDAFRGIAMVSADRDLVQTAKWLETIPKGAARDVAVSEFSRIAANSDPEGAAAWASTIADESTRTFDLNKILSTWMSQDKPAATRWVSSTTALPSDVKNRWLGKNP